MKSGVLLVRDREGIYEEILIDIDYNGFAYDYAKNTSRQITFTVFRTNYNKFSFDLLSGDSVIIYEGQEFIIKQCTPKVVGSLQTKDITAAHISFTVQDHYQYDSKESLAEYSLDDVMKFAIGGNELGFTYEIIGTFGKKTIESISANDALSLINDIACGTFGAIFYGNNKHLQLYSEDAWYREVQQTFRYLYNTNEVSVAEDITPIKTFIKAYGKEKENKDTKSDKSISQSAVSFSSKWADGVTSTKDSTASFDFTGTGVDVYFDKSKYGGKVHIDVDGANSKSGTTYSKKSGTLTLTIRGLENKKHKCNIKFTGADSTNPNTKKTKHVDSYNEENKQGKIVRKTKTRYTQEAATLEVNDPVANIYLENEGDDRYEAVVTYLSPAHKEWDIKMAPAVSSDTIKDKEELLEFAKSQLQDYPDMSLNIIYTGKELVDVRDVWLLIHEPLGISNDVKLVSLRSPHPYTGQPQTLTFSSAQKDMLKIQNQLRKSVSNLSKQLSGVNSTLSGNLPSLQEASRAIAAVSGNIEFDPDKGLKTTRKTKTSTPSTATVQTATISTLSTSPSYVTNFLSKIKNGAMETWNTHGILPSITAAQGALESNWGRSTLTIDCNNLFGIKAGSKWTGEKKAYRTAEQDSNGNVYYVTAYFRAYGSWAESILDHGQFFHDNSRYAAVIGLTDYTAQAQAIKAAGYATDTEYVSKLTSIIEAHDLASWDAAAISNEYVPSDEDSFEETEEESGSVYIGNGSISVVGEDGIESDVITPDGVDLSKSYGSVPDEVIDDITERIDLSADYMYLTSPNGTKFRFSVDDNGNPSMIPVDENTQ
ncbi:phage tail protein [Niallia taxi]|uniref:phage tail protein n=1 Tax=Niallia taxi TaxID=2499688 RepID=UPI003F61C12A